MGVALVDEDGEPVGQDRFQVHPDNVASNQLFLLCATQWKRSVMTGQLEGLNYDGVESAARMARIEVTPELFNELRLIERGALGMEPDFPELDDLQIINIGFDSNGN